MNRNTRFMKKGYIYYLENPITREIFYVGATEQSLEERLTSHYRHLSETIYGDRKTNNRLDYLLWLLPTRATIHLLAEVEDDTLDEKEKEFIEIYRKLNPKLTNMTIGGKGQSNYEFQSDERKQEISHLISQANKGKKKPEGFAENMSVKRKGLGNPAAKEISIGWIICFDCNSNKKVMFKYGFEINNFLGIKTAYGNVFKSLNEKRQNSKPYGYTWMLFKDCNKEIQDIVQSAYESKQ